jgi:hypothetical protein
MFRKAEQTLSLALTNQGVKMTGFIAEVWEVTLPKKLVVYVL